MRRHDKDPGVGELQRKLLALGYALPRFGADGELGDETLAAVAAFRIDHDLASSASEEGTEIPLPVLAAIERAQPVNFAPVDLTLAHPGAQWRPRAQRPWSQITGITLHQTAVVFGEQPKRWHGLDAHLGVTRSGRCYLVCPLDRVVWHGNGFNGCDVGVELDGYYEGIEGKRKTFWTPPQDPGRVPLQSTKEQIEATRSLVRWICAEVRRHGGQVRFIHAHRQSSSQRQSDPGSRIWAEVGVWAQRELGLTDGGRDFKVGQGMRIPEEWDSTRRGIAY